MKVEKVLWITPREFFEVIENSCANQNIYEGLVYEVKTSKNTIKIEILEYDETTTYSAKITNKDSLIIKYVITSENEEDGTCKVSYEEEFIPKNKIAMINNKISMFIFKSSMKKRMELKLKQVELEILRLREEV